MTRFSTTTLILGSLLVGIFSAVDTPAADEKVPLMLVLPKPMFKGTPVPNKVANLKKPLGHARPPMMVPKGTKMLSKDKPVTGSDDLPVIGELEMLTDGDKMGSDGSFVEFGPLLQHVQVDLEKASELIAMAVWHYHSQARVYHDVIIQASDDPDFIKGVKTIFNNDHDNSSGMGVGKDQSYVETSEGELVDMKSVVARYVRLYSRGSTTDEMNHYVEIEIWGKDAK